MARSNTHKPTSRALKAGLTSSVFYLIFASTTLFCASCVLFVAVKKNLIDHFQLAGAAIMLKSQLIFIIAFLSLLLICLAIFLMLINKIELRQLFSPIRIAIAFFILTLLYTFGVKWITHNAWGYRMNHMEDYIFLPAILVMLWAILVTFYKNKPWFSQIIKWIYLLMVGIFAFTVYHHASHLLNWQYSPAKVYWNDLAEAFLSGRLYLINPTNTHDLTLYNGNWYVPNPPLPAFIYLPFVALFGKANINAVTFSEILASINVVLVYLILNRASRLELIPTKANGNILITVLFAFGTPYWWLSILGQMWYLSQILTFTFASMALLLTLHQKSPWWIGVSLGLAIQARPNIFTLWPFLLAVTINLVGQPLKTIKWKPILLWAIKSAIPVIVSVALLLTYNYIRFNDFLDFGYVTINGADYIVEAAKKYGMFNLHFISQNLWVMFLKIPAFLASRICLPTPESKLGFSMFLATPALFFVFRRFKKSWTTFGALISIFLSILLLSLYHNTGAEQYGYRYILDFFLPLAFLLAVGIGSKPNWIFKILIGVSILMSIVGILWWFQVLC